MSTGNANLTGVFNEKNISGPYIQIIEEELMETQETTYEI